MTGDEMPVTMFGSIVLCAVAATEFLGQSGHVFQHVIFADYDAELVSHQLLNLEHVKHVLTHAGTLVADIIALAVDINNLALVRHQWSVTD